MSLGRTTKGASHIPSYSRFLMSGADSPLHGKLDLELAANVIDLGGKKKEAVSTLFYIWALIMIRSDRWVSEGGRHSSLFNLQQ